MKRAIPLVLALLILAACGAPAAEPSPASTPTPVIDEHETMEYVAGPSDEGYTFSTEHVSITIPEYISPVVAIGSGIPHFYENSSAWTLYYTPPEYEGFGTQICAIVEVPRGDFFNPDRFYNQSMTSVEVVGADSASFYVMVDPIGGIEIGHEEYDEYDALSRAMNGRFFMLHLTPAESDDLPTLAYQDLLTSANELDGQGDRTFTWAEAAVWAFDLLSAQNKGDSYPLNRGAYAGTGAEKAIVYLDSYGMLYGYEEGSLPPDKPFTRADFVQLLQRMQLARRQLIPYPGWLGDPVEAADLDETHWAYDVVNRAFQDGWLEMTDGKIRPDDPITAAEMARALRAAQPVLNAQH